MRTPAERFAANLTARDFGIVVRGDQVDVVKGAARFLGSLDEVDRLQGDALLVVPHAQAREAGYAVAPDETDPLVAIVAERRETMARTTLLGLLPNVSLPHRPPLFDIGDDSFAQAVRSVVDREIATGQGSNFVLHRTWTTQLEDFSLEHAMTLLRRMVESERGAYWTFLVRFGDVILVGASPELHVRLDGEGVASMNPISGTYRYPQSGPDLAGLMAFLADHKEREELFMVVDEELKMMSRVCDVVWVEGPHLREMSRLAHTEYFVRGRCSVPLSRLLRATLMAPTVVGSPLRNAFELGATRGGPSRGYYGGLIGLIERSEDGRTTFDSSILIRTMRISPDGELALPVGATVVRDSDPDSEVAETVAKAAGAAAALGAPDRPRPSVIAPDRRRLSHHPRVVAALAERNLQLASCWLAPEQPTRRSLAGRAVVIDHEDAFSSMLAQLLRRMGLEVMIWPCLPPVPEEFDLVILGPGPGDPRDPKDPRMARLRREAAWAVEQRAVAVLGICLGHQALALALGLQVEPLATPQQGCQRTVWWDGTERTVAFYNSFVPVLAGVVPDADVQLGPAGEVWALSRPGLESMQFHPESVLSPDGAAVLKHAVERLLSAGTPQQAAAAVLSPSEYRSLL